MAELYDLDYLLRELREAQTTLDQMPGQPWKITLRNHLDTLQIHLGGVEEWGRRADGSRPSDQRKKGKAA